MNQLARLFFCLTLFTPVWAMERDKDRVDNTVTALATLQTRYADALTIATAENASDAAIAESITRLKYNTRKLSDTIKSLQSLIPQNAPSLALKSEYARLQVLAKQARKTLKLARNTFPYSPSWLHEHPCDAQTFRTHLSVFQCDLETTRQFVSCFFEALAKIDQNLAHTKKRMRPLQEGVDGMIQLGRTVDHPVAREIGLTPLIQGATTLLLTAMQKGEIRTMMKQDPLLLRGTQSGKVNEQFDTSSDGLTLPKIAEVGRSALDHTESAKEVCNALDDFFKKYGPKGLAWLDMQIDKLVHAPAERQTPCDELTIKEFVRRHLNDDFTQKRVTDVLDFIIEPTWGPSALCLVQRLPEFMSSPFLPSEERQEIIDALGNYGIQPSDISRLSDKIKRQFNITSTQCAWAKEKTRESLTKLTEWLRQEQAEKIIAAAHATTGVAEKVVETLNDTTTIQTLGTLALDGLAVLTRKHHELTKQEKEIAARFKELGIYAQQALEARLREVAKNSEPQEE